MTQNHRLMLAVAISVLIISFWQEMYTKPRVVQVVNPQVVQEHVGVESAIVIEPHTSLSQPKISFENEHVYGTINLRGARIDELMLKDYLKEIDPQSPHVSLLKPAEAKDKAYFISIGWLTKDDGVQLPDKTTLWQQDASAPHNMWWDSPQGVRFQINISLDQRYMFTVEQSVTTPKGVRMKDIKPYISIVRGRGDERTEGMVHQGFVGFVGDKLKEIDFDSLSDDERASTFADKVEWVGFSDKYWLTALLPQARSDGHAVVDSYIVDQKPRFKLDLLYPLRSLKGGQHDSTTTQLFVGAKNLDLLEEYQKQYHLRLFDRTVDFGMLYFITKPIFMLLHMFHDYIGNFGVAILLLTVVIKMLLFPVAYKGYTSMAKLRKIQPQMTALKERYGEDNLGMQQALLALYKKEKVNPVAGCLPILLQMPVFFALYKVLSVTIEMRHAPFFGWIHDLSAPDPTTIFNLFGLLHWNPPSFLMVGVFPLLMALTMYWQQRLNPEPADKAQAQVMRLLPLIFLFMFSSFPSGMVIYWAWSNMLSIAQQTLIARLGH